MILNLDLETFGTLNYLSNCSEIYSIDYVFYKDFIHEFSKQSKSFVKLIDIKF